MKWGYERLDGCTELVEIAKLINFSENNIQNITSLCGQCSNLKSIKGLKNLNTENINIFTSAFENCYRIEDFSPIKNWKIKKTAVLLCMFLGCDSFYNTKEILNNWKIGKENNINCIFSDTTLNFPDKWDVTPEQKESAFKTPEEKGCSIF